MEHIFKSYDVRGIYPHEINEEVAYAIGRAFVDYLKPRTVIVGRDIRESSPRLFEYLAQGLMDQGADVWDIGEVSTPMLYFASHTLGSDGAIMITASHNPKEYNGMKFCRENAIPIGLTGGLADIRDRVVRGTFPDVQKRGTLQRRDIREDYYNHFVHYAHMGSTRLRVSVDCAHAMGIAELPILERLAATIDLDVLFGEYDSTFPAHEANPLNRETLKDLSRRIIRTGADVGIAYDGDADRIGFVDEDGSPVAMDIVTAIVARVLLETNPGATILYDLRSSRAVPETIRKFGGKPRECMVGHANIKKQMREVDALFAGELSGHYYYRDNAYAESSTLTAILLFNHISETGKSLKELVREINIYYHSGEINLQVADTQAVLKALKQKYHDGKLSELDGVKITYPNWWFSVRASNTEPVLRLNLEAETPEALQKYKTELVEYIAAH